MDEYDAYNGKKDDTKESGLKKLRKWVATKTLPPTAEDTRYYNCTTPQDYADMQTSMANKNKKKQLEAEYGKGEYSNVVSINSAPSNRSR